MSRRDSLFHLKDSAPAVLPSLLLCDFGNLEREVAKLEAAQVSALHLDVMDGVFVPNLTYGLPVVEACRRLTELPLDVHLMISDPGRYIRQFYEAGADILTIHAEAANEPASVLTEIRQLGAAAGLALNPKTPLLAVESCLDHCDMVLVMSVEAGFGGQQFDPAALDKLRSLSQSHPEIVLEVDGGINRQTISSCAAAGAQLFVVGSAIFRSERYEPVVDELTTLALPVNRN